MISIRFFKKHRQPVTARSGEVLMKALLAQSVPVASSCHGDGVCGKCRLRITDGAMNLSPETELESFLREKYSLKADERISCQTQVLGPVEVDASYW